MSGPGRRSPDPRELGAVGGLAAEDVLDALRLVRRGRVFDLDCGRFHGMPQWEGHPPFLLTTYRSPAGTRLQGDLDLLAPEKNSDEFAFASELMVTGMHIGTHLDALCHVASGGERWHGGYRPDEELGDFGARRADASTIPPILVRGVLLDVARARGAARLKTGDAIGASELEEVARAQGVDIGRRSAVLVRTGAMSAWPDRDAYDSAAGAGINLEAAKLLSGPPEAVLVGSDTPTVEQIPSASRSNPHPVHEHLIQERGVHLLEYAYLEDLSESKAYEFLLVCLPLKVEGATASMVRPVAVV